MFIIVGQADHNTRDYSAINDMIWKAFNDEINKQTQCLSDHFLMLRDTISAHSAYIMII